MCRTHDHLPDIYMSYQRSVLPLVYTAYQPDKLGEYLLLVVLLISELRLQITVDCSYCVATLIHCNSRLLIRKASADALTVVPPRIVNINYSMLS